MSASAEARGGPLALLFAIPADVWLVIAGLVDAHLAVLLPPGSPARIFIALVTLLILPGYALTTAVFPAARASRGFSPTSLFGSAGDSPLSNRNGRTGPAALSGVERAALTFGLSVALIPLFGAAVELIYGSYRLESLLVVVTVFVLVALAVGSVRRYRTPADQRYELPIHDWLAALRASLSDVGGVDLALNVALALALVVSASTLTLALVAPQDGSDFTEVYLLAPQDDGDLAGKNYPTEFNRSEARELAFAVENREGEAVSYTVVSELQRLDSNGEVVEDARLDRFERRVAAGETWQQRHNVTPTLVGENLRLTYLVYKGDPPSELSTDTAYRYVSLRINVSASPSASSSTNSSATNSTATNATSMAPPAFASVTSPDSMSIAPTADASPVA